MEQSRRDFLKKSAVAGGIVWAVPAISSLPAGAQAAGTPCAGDCTGGARAVFLDPPLLANITLGADSNPASTGPVCATALELASIAGLTVACGEFDGATCSANAQVAGVGVALVGGITFSALTSSASAAGCPDVAPTGTSNVVNLTIPGTAVVNVSTSANSTVTVDLPIAGTITVVINEQVPTCVNGQSILTVRALHITVTGSLGGLLDTEIILAESVVSNTCCTC